MAQRKKRRVPNRKRSSKGSQGFSAPWQPGKKKRGTKGAAKSSNAPKLRGKTAKAKPGGGSLFSRLLRLFGR